MKYLCYNIFDRNFLMLLDKLATPASPIDFFTESKKIVDDRSKKADLDFWIVIFNPFIK